MSLVWNDITSINYQFSRFAMNITFTCHAVNHFIKKSLSFIIIKSVSRLEATEKANCSLKLKLSLIQKSALTAEEKVKDMEVLLKDVIADGRALRIETHRLVSQLLEATSKKQEKIAEEKMISLEIDVRPRFNLLPKHLLRYIITGCTIFWCLSHYDNGVIEVDWLIRSTYVLKVCISIGAEYDPFIIAIMQVKCCLPNDVIGL